MDRGYYSKALFKEFDDDAGIHVIFRAKRDTSKKEWSDSKNDIISSKDGVDCRFVKYTVENVDYMMITNLLDTETKPVSVSTTDVPQEMGNRNGIWLRQRMLFARYFTWTHRISLKRRTVRKLSKLQHFTTCRISQYQ